jgi:hypothetical protein
MKGAECDIRCHWNETSPMQTSYQLSGISSWVANISLHILLSQIDIHPLINVYKWENGQHSVSLASTVVAQFSVTLNRDEEYKHTTADMHTASMHMSNVCECCGSRRTC